MTMNFRIARHYLAVGDEPSIVITKSAPAPVLLIDANEDCREALGMLIDDIPGVGPVRTAASATDALPIARAESPAIIYFDAPRTPDSVDVVKALRAASPGSAVVLLCLYPEHLQPGMAAVVDHCLHKDVSYAELESITLRLLADARPAHGGA